MDQLDETDLALLYEACTLQVQAFRLRARLAEHEVEKLNFTIRAERVLSLQEKIQTELTSRYESLSWE